MTAVKPMLAVKADNLDALPYPLLASVKLDGIRCLITPDGPQTRSGEPIPNLYVRAQLERLPAGLDGELVCLTDGVPDFRKTTGDIRRAAGEPNFLFRVFDDYLHPGPFAARYASLLTDWRSPLAAPSTRPWWCQPLTHEIVEGPGNVRAKFAEALASGNEGLILRDPKGQYKHGRSALASAGMLKVKPYEDAEAVVLSAFEREHNTNEATKDALGHTKRADTKDGKQGTGLLGGYEVVRLEDVGVDGCPIFRVSAGKTTHEEKAKLWAEREAAVGQIIRYQHVTVGGYDVPRHATFQGFRAAFDMDRG